MNRKYVSTIVIILIVSSFLSGCGPSSAPAIIPTDVEQTPIPTETSTATSSLVLSTDTATIVPTPTEPPIETSIAYVQNDALLVTHVMAGEPLDTREYVKSTVTGGIYNIEWSPTGEFLAFNMWLNAFTHVFVMNVNMDGDPVDLGIANDFAWSPNGKSLAFEHEYELWLFSTQDGQSRRLTTHLGTDWLWTKPVFTPTGDALIVAGTVANEMDRHGNTRYKLYRVPLDGSAANAYPTPDMPALTDAIYGRMPLALRFSPDGQKLATITFEYIDGCAELANYRILDATGGDFRELSVPSLATLGGPEQKMYMYGDSFVWTSDSAGLWINGQVKSCGLPSGIVAGPQISHLTLDGQEHEIIAGNYKRLSLDRTGMLLGVVNMETIISHVQILGVDGHLVLDLGEGDMAVLQP